jgi:ketosteroid isomerase-like protein
MIMPDEILRARTLFERQIDCLRRDDRVAQAKLYADDLVYDFPFAVDRPRHIEGKEAFLAVMRPMWEAVRGRAVNVVGYREEITETADPDSLVAEFTLVVQAPGGPVDVSFVQFFRTRNGKIAAVREYFSPVARSEALRE